MFFKLTLLACVVAAASATATCAAPGSTVTTVTTSTTTVSFDDEGSGGILTPHERSLVRKSWEQAKKDGDVAPKILFNFIKAHPGYQSKFSKFASVPQSELMTNGNFLAQAYTILAGMNVVVQSMSSSELLAGQMNALGGAHQPRGITPAMFEEFGAVIMQVLEEELGTMMDAQTKTAWQHAHRALVAGVSKTLKKPEDLPDPQTKMTPHQVRDVQRSWENVRAGRNALVSELFIKLFKETPRVQKHFAKFSSVPVDALTGNAEFNKQVALVADRLDVIVAAMDDKLQINGNINYMKYTHLERGIPRSTFEDFGRLLVEGLAAKGVSADDLASWKGALIVFVNGVSPKA